MSRTGAGKPCTYISRTGRSCPNLTPCELHPPRDRNAPWSQGRDSTTQGRFRRATLQHDNWTCTRCGHHDASGKTLDAHHVTPDLGTTLCNECHLRIDPKARRRKT